MGAGISGIVAAHLLSRQYQVTLLEKRPRLGGHTHTWEIPDGPDEGTRVDTGFIVCNDKTYPNFHRFLNELEVPWRWSDMSFGFWDERTNLHYAGTNLDGLFAQRSNALRPGFLAMLLEIRRFCRESMAALENNPAELEGRTLGGWLRDRRFGQTMIDNYLVPMGAAIWSTSPKKMLRFPALTYIRFFKNHGLLSLADRPRWQTVKGGSDRYVEAFQRQFNGTIRTGISIATIKRNGAEVDVHTVDGEQFSGDHLVMAVHADQVLPLLEKPTEAEEQIFSQWRYERNRVVLHTDTSVMPPSRRAWASWNYTREAEAEPDDALSMSYHMNRLQGLRTRREYLVTLNRKGRIDERRIIAEFVYNHPLYTRASLATQDRIYELNGDKHTYYCGAWCFNGFHEDGTRSAVRVAKALGVDWG